MARSWIFSEHRHSDGGHDNGEINDKIQANIHWDGYGRGVAKSVGSENIGTGLGSGFHTYGLLWDAARYRVLIDGRQLYDTVRGISDRSEYLIFSSEVGFAAPAPKWSGILPPAGYGDRAISTTKMKVDYVRFYAPTNTVYYSGGSSGDWNDSNNWIAGKVPASVNDVIFSYLSTNHSITTLQK